MKFLTLILASSFLICSAFAAPITEIKTTGLKRIERDAILEKISSKTGKEYSNETVRSDIEALFGMGYFDDIVISKDTSDKGVILTYDFKERPIINDVAFEGNDKISTSDLEDAIKVKKWAILDTNKVQADMDIIQKLYEEKGYYLTKVSYDVRKEKEGEVKLVYKVSDYDKVEIKRISFINNHRFDAEKLKAVFAETKEGSSAGFLSGGGTFKEAAFRIDLQRLTYFYLENGYLKFRFEQPVVTISDDKKYVYISLYVDEGQQYTVGGYDFSGDLLFPKDELKKEVKLTEGSIFNITTRNADIQRLTEKYQDLGYAFVNVVPKMEFNEENKSVNVDYGFEKGNLVHFGEIRMVGNTKTYDKVIRRELRVYEGELFSGSKLRISRERVERLGYFEPGSVTFNQVPRKGRDDLVDIEVSVKERSTGSVTVGAGYSSIQGLFFQGKVQEINLFGSGQTISLDAQWGNDNTVRSVSVSFLDPYAFDTDWSAGTDLFMANSPIPDRYLIRRSGFDLKVGHPLSDDIQGYITYKFEYLDDIDNYATDRNNAIVQGLTTEPPLIADDSKDKGLLSSIVLSAVRDKRNNRYETTGGNYQSLSFEYAGLGGVKKFAKVIANNRYYNNFAGSFVFKNSTELGVVMNMGGEGIPPSEEFFLGGPWNLRGFDAFTVAPVLYHPPCLSGNPQQCAERIGGASEFYSLFELEHPLIKEAGIKFVLFYDIGNSFMGVPGFDKGQAFNLRQDYGFGIRWFSPLGPLRFEWGFPINPVVIPTTGLVESSPEFIFFIGQPF